MSYNFAMYSTSSTSTSCHHGMTNSTLLIALVRAVASIATIAPSRRGGAKSAEFIGDGAGEGSSVWTIKLLPVPFWVVNAIDPILRLDGHATTALDEAVRGWAALGGLELVDT